VEEAIERFLRQQLPDAASVRVHGLRIIAGGYSEETYALDCDVRRGQAVETLALILRRDPPPEADILPTSRLREHNLINAVATHTTIPVPRSLFLDIEGAALDRPAMFLERVRGSSDLSPLAGGADPEQLEQLSTDLCEQLAELHRAPVDQLDPEGALRDVRGGGIDTTNWQTYINSVLDYMKRSYASLAFDPLPVFYDGIMSLRNRLPAPGRLSVCHGDFQPSNFLYENGRVTGIIDWENAHVGDPREDLGWLYHMQALMGVDIMGSVKADGGFLEHYTKLSGIPVTMDDVRFYRLFTSLALSAPILDAVRRRLDGESSGFMPVYLLQPLVASIPLFAMVLDYPPAAEVA